MLFQQTVFSSPLYISPLLPLFTWYLLTLVSSPEAFVFSPLSIQIKTDLQALFRALHFLKSSLHDYRISVISVYISLVLKFCVFFSCFQNNFLFIPHSYFVKYLRIFSSYHRGRQTFCKRQDSKCLGFVGHSLHLDYTILLL